MQISISNIVKGSFIGSAFTAISRYFTRVTSTGGIYEGAACAEAAINRSSILDKASLIFSPSGYKEDLLYSEFPLDGSGDLSFTRASNGTRVNSAGFIEVCPWNLLGYSEEFNNAAWTKDRVTVSSNVIAAPNGTTTADKVVDTLNGSNTYRIYNSLTLSATTYTMTVYAKAAEYSWCYIRIGNALRAWYNISTGTVGTVASGLTASIESAGNGWYKLTCTIATATAGGGFGLVGLCPSDNVETYTPSTGGMGVYLWGAQLNIGSTAKPYFPTTDRLNVARLTYQNGGGGCPSLLLEKQSTNLLTYSEDFTNAAYSKQEITVTANASTAPDGTNTATRVTPTTVTGTHQISRTLVSIAQHTISVFVKANGYNTIEILDFGTGSNGATFDVSAGTVTNKGTGTGTITNFGNGWYRCTATCLTTGIRFYIPTSSGTFTGNGTSGLFIWGAQMEASSYPTSYIPTTSSSATRVADACSKTGISSLIGQSEGSLFAQVSIPRGAEGSRAIAVQGGSDRVGITVDGTSVGFFIVNSGGVVYSSATSITWQATNKLAVAYKSGNSTLYVNGVAVLTTSASFTLGGAMANLYLGQYEFAPGTGQNGQRQSQAILFPTRLTNAELAQLTA